MCALEMDEDFMADPAGFSLRSDASRATGARRFSGARARLLRVTLGQVKRVSAEMAMPYPTRRLARGRAQGRDP